MVARITTVAFQGIEAVEVDVQVMIAPGKMSMNIVGLADKAVAESRERVQAAFHACGLSMPVKRVTINLAPADLPKEGSHYDLPIAISLMMAMGILPTSLGEKYIALGELSLDGAIAAVNGVLPAAMAANGLNKNLICPQVCGSEAAWAGQEIDILAPASLLALVNHFRGEQLLSRPQPVQFSSPDQLPDMADIKGQYVAKRALEIAAAGRHNLLYIGPPGSGKSMLAQRLPSILPPMTARELLETSMVASIAGALRNGTIVAQRPFRAPHHSASMPAIIGGGAKAKPGEISLAHNGVLFLDELPEFSPHVLDSLRQPLETGEVNIARANAHISYPARFQLIAAMNPCRCGMAGEPGHVCPKAPKCQTDYQSRISGPLMDRIDLRVEVPAVPVSEMLQQQSGESSATIATRVLQARQRQIDRFQSLGLPHIQANGDCPTSLVEKIAMIDGDGQKLLTSASEHMRLSARAYHRILKLARTLADLDNSDLVLAPHIAEALSYRNMPEQIVS